MASVESAAASFAASRQLPTGSRSSWFNDLTDVGTLAHLLRHDSLHGKFPGTVDVKDGHLVVSGTTVTISAEKTRRRSSGRTRGRYP